MYFPGAMLFKAIFIEGGTRQMFEGAGVYQMRHSSVRWCSGELTKGTKTATAATLTKHYIKQIYSSSYLSFFRAYQLLLLLVLP